MKKQILFILSMFLLTGLVGCAAEAPETVAPEITGQSDEALIHFDADSSGGYEQEPWDEGDELVDFLLASVPFAYDMVYGQGMSALVTGDTVDLTDMGAGVCRVVILGTDHPEHFVNEEFFAISDEWNIYVYSVIEDIWWYYAPYAHYEEE